MAKKMQKKPQLAKEMRGKLTFTYIVILCLFLLLAVRIIYWNIRYGKEYSTTVLGQQTNSNVEIPYERGKIFDRNGNLLAGNEKLYTLILEPKNILAGSPESQKENLNMTVEKVSEFFELDSLEVRQAILNNPESYYIPIKTGLNYQIVEKFKKFNDLRKKKKEDAQNEQEKALIDAAKKVRGVTFEENFKRIYPYGSLACHLLGYTVSGNVGNWGLEQYYNSTLNGTNGRLYYYFDEELVQEKTVKEAVNGNSLVTTIDLQIQQVIEKKIKEFDDAIGSKETSVIVMDPNNGEVLAMANSRPYDLNDPNNMEYLRMLYSDSYIQKILEHTDKVQQAYDEGDKDKYEKLKKSDIPTKTAAFNKIWKNSIITDTNEPGSTYKPFTVGAGLESGVLTGKEKFNCSGSYNVAKHNIGCSHVHGKIDLKHSIAESCNVAMMNIAFREKADSFYYYQNLFGFGQKTGIDLPGETDTRPVVYTAETYGNDASLATNAFGQNFNCTMIEMISGFASLINGGYYYKPHVVKEIQNSNGDIVETIKKEMLRQTISEQTSKTLRSYLKETVDSGTGTKAQIAGYTIGGKTGTAEKKGRNKKDYYISFMGFTPVNNPKLLIYVTIDEPHIDNQANARMAVCLERECMKEIVEILGIQPTGEVKKSDQKEVNYIKEYLKEHKKKTKKKKKASTEKKSSTQAAKDAATSSEKKDTTTSTKKKKDSAASTEKKKPDASTTAPN